MFLKTPKNLPFLEAVCWQNNIWSLAPQEMLHRYERGWHYRSVLAELVGEEAEFVRELCRRYVSWIDMSFELEYHQKVLAVLNKQFLNPQSPKLKMLI